MRLRAESIEAFSSASFGRSHAKIVRALRQVLPTETARYASAEFAAFCDRGIAKAASHGLITERSAYVYIATMILFGEDFYTDPLTPWGRQILDGGIVEQEVKAKALELQVAIDKGKRI